MTLVVEEGPLRAADRPGVVEEQEVDPVGVVERAVIGGDDVGAFQGARRVGLSRRRLVAAGLGGDEGAQGDRSGDAACRVAAGRLPLGEDVRVLQDGQRRDHRHVGTVGRQVVVQRLELGDAVGIEELGDRVPFVHRDETEHRLPTEEVLVGGVVNGDLVVGVEIAVLTGGELQAGDAESQDEREDQPDEGDETGVPAELDGQP